MLNFNDLIELDHGNMLTSNEFGISCTNARTGLSFNIIKTDTFIEITADGSAIIEDKPMFNTQKTNDIKQYDSLAIGTNTYIVRDVRSDGIGGIDVYLKG